jgi:hypothetical protein
MILSGILYIMLWPLVIVCSYLLIKWALKHYESKIDDSEKNLK